MQKVVLSWTSCLGTVLYRILKDIDKVVTTTSKPKFSNIHITLHISYIKYPVTSRTYFYPLERIQTQIYEILIIYLFFLIIIIKHNILDFHYITKRSAKTGQEVNLKADYLECNWGRRIAKELRAIICNQDSLGKSINIKAMFLYAGLSTEYSVTVQSLVLRPISRGLVQ